MSSERDGTEIAMERKAPTVRVKEDAPVAARGETGSSDPLISPLPDDVGRAVFVASDRGFANR